MTRRDWLLLFIAYEGAPAGLDPVRLQKGMFLFAEETHVPPAQKYDFRPYNYGPMSPAIYADVDALLAGQLVESTPVEGQSWSRYKATAAGVRRGHELLRQARQNSPAAAAHLYRTKSAVAGMSFDVLLEDVYERYPDYASQSVFRRRA